MKWVVTTILVLAVAALIALLVLQNGEAPAAQQSHRNDTLLSDNSTSMTDATSTFTLTSSTFAEGETIPVVYTCDGDNINPPLSISGVPEEAASLALIMEDPDIPESIQEQQGIDVFDHWIVYNMPPSTVQIAEGQEPEGVLGRNTAGGTGYTGPCPPDAEHRYIFTLYALDTTLELEAGATKQDVREAMEGHVIAETQLMGRYER